MRDEADVGLVDAHAEGDGRGNHHLFGLNERSLVPGANLRLKPRVVGQRRAAVAANCSAIRSVLSRLGA